MANKNNAKVQFTAETKEFNEAISKSNEEMANLRAELKLNATQMKANGTSIDGLEKKHSLLENQLEASQNKIEAINEKIKASLRYYDENSSEVLKLKTQLANAKTEEERLQSAIAECNEELNKQKTSSKDAGEGFTVMKGVIADLTSNAIQGAIDKISEFAGYIMSLPAETMELRQDMATLTTAFDDMGFSTDEATDTWKELYKVFGEDDRAVETANNISKIADNQKDLNSWVDITTGVWGTYQDSLPVEGLAEASMETAKTGTVTGALADALNWGAKEGEMFGLKLQDNIKFTELSSAELKKLTDSERAEYEAKKKQYEEIEEYNNVLQNSTVAEEKFQLALNNCSSEQERQQLITNTLTNLYGSAAETYRDASAAQMEAKEATAENILAENELATAIEPVTIEFNKLKNEALIQLVPVVQEVSNVMLGALDWMQAHPTAMQVIIAVVGVLATSLTTLAVATTVQTAAQWAMNSAILANPITWISVGIVAAVTSLITVGILLYKNWDTIKAKGSELWNSLKNTFSKMGKSLSNSWNDMKKDTANAWNSMKNSMASTWSNMKKNTASTWNSIKSNAVNNCNSMKSSMSATWGNMKKNTVSTWNDMKNNISKTINSTKTTVKKGLDSIASFFKGLKLEFPKIKMPHFTIKGKFSIDPPSVPSFGVKWYKNGGIMTKPTIFGFNGINFMAGGEAGPEAILPIDKLEGYIINAIAKISNTIDIQALADKIERLADRPIELNINGKQFAQATASDTDSVNGLRSTFKSRGLILD